MVGFGDGDGEGIGFCIEGEIIVWWIFDLFCVCVVEVLLNLVVMYCFGMLVYCY